MSTHNVYIKHALSYLIFAKYCVLVILRYIAVVLRRIDVQEL